MEGEKFSATPRNIRTSRHDAHIIRWQRVNNTSGSRIVCVVTVHRNLLSSLNFLQCFFFIFKVRKFSLPVKFFLQSTQFFDIYLVNSSCLSRLDFTCAHPFNLTDVDWCPHDSNALVYYLLYLLRAFDFSTIFVLFTFNLLITNNLHMKLLSTG